MNHNVQKNKSAQSAPKNRLQIAIFMLLAVLVGIVLSEPIHQEISARLTGVRGAVPATARVSQENGWGTLISWVRSGDEQRAVLDARPDFWAAKIAFGYDGVGDEPDPEFLGSHVSWLILKYGMEEYRNQVKQAGFDGRLLQYQTTFQILGPGPYTTGVEKCENNYTPVNNNPMWTDDFCSRVHKNDDWFLHNGSGERLYSEKKNWDGTTIYNYYMNPASDGFRKFWVDQFKRQRNEQEWQAIFLDNVAINYTYLERRPDNQDGTVKEYSSTADWQQAMSGLLQHLKQAFPNVELWGNMIEGPNTADAWDFAISSLDGFQDESFATGWVDRKRLTAGEWNAALTRAQKLTAQGKGVVMQSQGKQDDIDRMRFSLASYLLVATEADDTYFRYTYTQNYSELWWYSEYGLSLGPPLGDRYQEGERWLRDFACGQVAVDPATYETTIELRTCKP